METELMAAILLKINRLEKRVSELESETAWRSLLEEAEKRGVAPDDLLKDLLSRYNVGINKTSKEDSLGI